MKTITSGSGCHKKYKVPLSSKNLEENFTLHLLLLDVYFLFELTYFKIKEKCLFFFISTFILLYFIIFPHKEYMIKNFSIALNLHYSIFFLADYYLMYRSWTLFLIIYFN